MANSKLFGFFSLTFITLIVVITKVVGAEAIAAFPRLGI